MDSTTPSVKAGEAYLRAIENDPDKQAALERARVRLQALAKAGQVVAKAVAKAKQRAMDSPEYRALKEAERQCWQDLTDTIRQGIEANGDELESRHFDRPETIEDWEHLARIVEVPDETIKTGDWTAGEIFECALAWADRQTIKTKLAADVQADNKTNAQSERRLGQDSQKTHSEDTGGGHERNRRTTPKKINKKKPFCDKARSLSKEFKRQVDDGASITLEAFCNENARNFVLAPTTARNKLSANRSEWDPDRKYFRT